MAHDLAEDDPTAFLPVLAESLVDRGHWLWEEKSLREESVSTWRKAAAIYGELAKSYPERFGRSHTSSLEILISAFRALQRWDDELAVIDQALDAYGERAKRIADVRRQIAEPKLAVLLQRRREPATGKQAFGRARSQQRKRALAAARDAAARCGKVAESKPTEFLPDLADAVHGLAVELQAVGKRRAAWILADGADRIRNMYWRSVDVTRREAWEKEPLPRMDYLTREASKIRQRWLAPPQSLAPPADSVPSEETPDTPRIG